MIDIEYPNELLEIFITLHQFSSNTFLVGGCVRDMMLHKTPKDFDIVTDVDLDIIIPIFKSNGWKISEVGKQFLVLIVSKNSLQFEISLFRKDGTYIDGRRPDTVSIGTIDDDFIRRDFCINSLYYNPMTNTLLDPSNRGIDDIKNRIVRFNGNPTARVQEDYLRIARAYRFAATLGFEIEQKTLKACRRNFGHMIQSIAHERIRIEFEKMVEHING